MLASFASSEEGKAFARIEERWGRDPAAWLKDDVLAHNLRAAFIITLAKDEPEEEHDDAVERARRAGQQIKERMNG